MEKADALKILQQLADGIDPQTSQPVRADSPYQHPDTVRALFVALRALVTGVRQPEPVQVVLSGAAHSLGREVMELGGELAAPVRAKLAAAPDSKSRTQDRQRR